MKTFAQLNEEIEEVNEIFGKKKPREITSSSASPEAESVAKDAYANRNAESGGKGEDYNPKNPLHSVPAQHLHSAISAHLTKHGKVPSQEELAHHARMGWAHAVDHLSEKEQAGGNVGAKAFKTKGGGSYELSRRANANLAHEAERKGKNSVQHLYDHLRHNGVSHEDAKNYSGDPGNRLQGYDSQYGNHYAAALKARRAPNYKGLKT